MSCDIFGYSDSDSQSQLQPQSEWADLLGRAWCITPAYYTHTHSLEYKICRYIELGNKCYLGNESPLK